MIFWNMKYLFIIISSCYCVVRAVSLQFKLLCRRIDTQYKQHLQKDCQFYRRVYQRTGTRRYFIESCKKITAFCHNYQRIYRWNSTRRYFTESYKKITAFCHNYRWIGTRRYFTESYKKITAFYHNYRWIGTRRYFTESCKKITVFCHNYWRPCHNYRRIYRRVHRRMAHIPKRTPVRSCRRTRQNQCASALTHNFRRICRRTLKNMEGFLKFLVRKSIKYWQNLMPPPKKIFVTSHIERRVSRARAY